MSHTGERGGRTSPVDRRARPSLVVLGALALLTAPGCGEEEGGGEPAMTFTVDLETGVAFDGPAPTTIGALPAGTYRTSTFQPHLTFTVGDGWSLVSESAGDMYLPMGIGFAEVDVVNAAAEGVGVYDTPVDVGREADPPGPYRPFPDDYVAWLRSVPELDVGPARPTTVGGVDGVVVEVGFGGLPPGGCFGVGDRRCFAFLRPPDGGELVQFGASRVEIHVLDVQGSPVVLFVFDRHSVEAEATAFLDSVTWGDG